jgi:hypothetical protein
MAGSSSPSPKPSRHEQRFNERRQEYQDYLPLTERLEEQLRGDVEELMAQEGWDAETRNGVEEWLRDRDNVWRALRVSDGTMPRFCGCFDSGLTGFVAIPVRREQGARSALVRLGRTGESTAAQAHPLDRPHKLATLLCPPIAAVRGPSRPPRGGPHAVRSGEGREWQSRRRQGMDMVGVGETSTDCP